MRFGISGHQSLEERLEQRRATHSEATAWEWVERTFANLLSDSAASGNVVVSSLAAGADQRLSCVALEHGVRLEVVVPSATYEETFTDKANLSRYAALLSQAAEVIRLDHPEPSEEAYLAAGKYVVDHTDTIVAVWDGRDAEGLGGTGDIVAYAFEQGRPVLHLDPIRRTVNRSLDKE